MQKKRAINCKRYLLVLFLLFSLTEAIKQSDIRYQSSFF